MNWRWKAIAQKIDPAMLANTVPEYLLPKIELGLLYAYGITEAMCIGWTRIIVHTLAQVGGMNKTISKNSSHAFCLLSVFGFWTDPEAMHSAEFKCPLMHHPYLFPGHRINHRVIGVSCVDETTVDRSFENLYLVSWWDRGLFSSFMESISNADVY